MPFKPMGQKSPKTTLPLWSRGRPSNTPVFRLTPLHPKWQLNRFAHICTTTC